ncbi:unnamed protein product [Strongylus vulgaris]|uniref:PLD phosphodiesterase domain-containing protein n=1 Tax=Strongylus vulgaris TaxID=40348 RepID=A0A3P7IQY9_STRVU|nr:unnamed protein product [Strongylus vulgaris]
MELGVLVENCDCLAEDLKNIFDVYWNIPKNSQQNAQKTKAYYNMEKPLEIKIEGERSAVYLATSPKELNNRARTWDLDAIVTEIDNANESLDIHVMDYFPLIVYSQPKKIFKVPSTDSDSIVINRERRTHNKFMVSESAVIIGTSNWSGDYFIGGTTGAAIVIKQNGEKRALVKEMQAIFERDWSSDYAHPLEDYFTGCIERGTQADFCENEKDPSLFESSLTD